MEQGIKNQLPCEIIEEILYKLPVKSLLRFKCVSKPWRSIISSKYFIKRHLKKSSTNTDLANPNKLFFFKYYHTCTLSLKKLSPNTELTDLTSLRNSRNYNDHSNGYCRVVGSCNGLTLVTVDAPNNLLLLWNPSTRQVKEILPPASFTDEAQSRLGQTNLSSWGDLRCFVFGFGYNESTDDYKVVCRHNYRKSHWTQMYSSKSDSWKKIQNFDKGYTISRSAKYVNGRFHWLALRDQEVRNIFDIVSLDLSEEKYETLNLEEFLDYNDYNGYRRILSLDELGGYLSLVIVDADLRDINVWAMMEYGKRESWAKVWTLSDFFVYDDRRFLLNALPLCLKKNGDIAVKLGSIIVVYNGKNKLCRSRFNISDPQAVLYAESLVSPFDTDEQ